MAMELPYSLYLHPFSLLILTDRPAIEGTKLNFIINLDIDGRSTYSLSLSRIFYISAQIFNMFY